MEGGWRGYQENTLAGTVSGARAKPPGGYFYTSNAGNRLSVPRIDARSMPPTQNVIQDALKDGEWSKKEGVGRDRLPGGRLRRLGWGSSVLS